MHNVRLQGYAKWKAELTLDAELYLKVQQVNRRRMWTKLRGGCLELRVETGRWETTMVMGKQVKMPRWVRLCTLCFEEVEDAEHTLFRCPCFNKLRTAFLESCGLAGKELSAAREVLSGQRGREPELMRWMMNGGVGHGMRFLEQVMAERARLL